MARDTPFEGGAFGKLVWETGERGDSPKRRGVGAAEVVDAVTAHIASLASLGTGPRPGDLRAAIAEAESHTENVELAADRLLDAEVGALTRLVELYRRLAREVPEQREELQSRMRVVDARLDELTPPIAVATGEEQ